MSKEIFEALKGMEQQSGIASELLIENIKMGIIRAINHDYPKTENVRVEIDPVNEIFEMAILKTVVAGTPEDPANEITLDEARTYDTGIAIGQTCAIPIDPISIHRVAASTAKQSIQSDIRKYERERLVEQYREKEFQLVFATVQKVEPATGNAVITIDKDEIYFPKSEHIPGEVYRPGEHIKVYVVSVRSDKKPYVRVSRSHQDFVKKLFELEVPEIFNGEVEIKAISREAGSRSKIAVAAKEPNVDPIGACIGPKRARIAAVMEELHGEKIDLIPYSENSEEFIASALAPAEVISVTVHDTEPKSCTVVVPNNQLSLAIGNKGQNAKLAARLTKFKIDIVSEDQLAERGADETAEAAEDPDTQVEE